MSPSIWGTMVEGELSRWVRSVPDGPQALGRKTSSELSAPLFGDLAKDNCTAGASAVSKPENGLPTML